MKPCPAAIRAVNRKQAMFFNGLFDYGIGSHAKPLAQILQCQNVLVHRSVDDPIRVAGVA